MSEATRSRVDTRTQRLLADPRWLLATTLGERTPPSHPAPAPDTVDSELGARRLRRWLAEPAFDDDESILDERLAASEMDRAALLALLGEEPVALAERLQAAGVHEPPWLSDLRHAYRTFPDPPREAAEDREADVLYRLRSNRASAVLTLAAPLLRWAEHEIFAEIDALALRAPRLFAEPESVAESLLRQLGKQLKGILSRTVVLELNIARLEESLEGDTPEARFDDFAARFADTATSLELLLEYPVLARTLSVATRLWLEAGRSFLRDVHTDAAAISDTFHGGGQLGALVRVQGDAGDLHRGGRTVSIVGFDSGLRLVYKPHPVSVDICFQRLLRWLGERGAEPDHRTLSILDRGDHGWVEYLDPAPCADAAQVERFYRRQGSLLALLYCLHAVDFHYENLIAVGEYPVPVDLEALFHPLQWVAGDPAGTSTGTATLQTSVMAVGLLPRRGWIEGSEEDGGEFSGLGGGSEQLSAVEVADMDMPATDEMHVTKRRVTLPGGDNQAKVGTEAVDVLEHVDDVLGGFTDTCVQLIRLRDDLLAADGPLAAFASTETRCIVRPTQVYSSVLFDATHPDLLRNGLMRDRYLDNLWTTEAKNPVLRRLSGCEQHDLHRGDVPVFTARPETADVWCPDGHRHTDLLLEPVLEMVRRRIATLDDDEISRQSWVVRASFTAMILGEGRFRWPVREVTEAGSPASSAELLGAAERTAQHVEMLMLGEGDDVGWLGLELLGERVWVLRPLGMDLYAGLPGMALFLGYLGEVSGSRAHTELARRTVATLLTYLDESEESLRALDVPPFGAFEQVSGSVYALTQLGALWGRDDLLERAENLVGLLGKGVEETDEYDIIGGLSGLVCVALGVHRVRGDGGALDLAVRAGERLLALAEPAGGGIAWRDGEKDVQPLAGFSHGASGVLTALLRLAEATGAERFRAAAGRALDYERSVYDPVVGNWPDLRDYELAESEGGAAAKFMTAWCHGAPGIGLARVEAMRTMDDPRLADELRAAVGATLNEGMRTNNSLCHGSVGNLELLASAARALGDDELSARTYRLAADLLASFETDGWLCGVPGGVETPGLMTGLAGIGYGILRLSAPDVVPSVLTLDPPPSPTR